MSSPSGYFVGSVVLIFLVFVVSYYVLSSILWCPLRFPHGSDGRFVICIQLFVWGGGVPVSYLCYLCFCFCFSSSCVRYVSSFSGLSIWNCPSVFSDVYLQFDQPFVVPPQCFIFCEVVVMTNWHSGTWSM